MSKQAIIETKELSKHYQDGNVIALDKVSISIYRSEIFVIKGASGSGKSTLLHLLGGLDTATSGGVYFEGKLINDLLPRSRFRIETFGFIFQLFYLWPTLNVLENVYLPLMALPGNKKHKAQNARELVCEVGLEHKLSAAVKDLSVGERQRVAIARALVASPRVVFADEPTGSLDSHNAQAIMALLKKLNRQRGVTIVMVTHDLGLRDFADRSIELLDGKVKL